MKSLIFSKKVANHEKANKNNKKEKKREVRVVLKPLMYYSCL